MSERFQLDKQDCDAGSYQEQTFYETGILQRLNVWDSKGTGFDTLNYLELHHDSIVYTFWS